ncbi:hypothetical protein ACTXT7_005260 [Hymenolepis weldensis]
MSSEDREIIYPLVINQLLHDGYGVFAISLKKLVNSNSDAVASDKLLKIVKLGLAVSKFLEDSNLSKDFSHLAHAFQPNHHNGASFLNSSSSSNNQSIDQSPQQSLHQNGSQNGQFSLGLDPPIKLEPGDSSFNFPFSAYHRQWSQITNNRVNINLDGEIHELPGDGSPIKLFECSLCGKIFNRRDKVKRHLSELHHGIKRHQCATCFRLFSRNDKLVRHIMTVHQGTSPYFVSQRFVFIYYAAVILKQDRNFSSLKRTSNVSETSVAFIVLGNLVVGGIISATCKQLIQAMYIQCVMVSHEIIFSLRFGYKLKVKVTRFVFKAYTLEPLNFYGNS